MRIKRIGLLLVLIPIMVILANAQPNLSMFAFENHFNSSSFNPAFLSSKERFTFSIFPLAGMSLGFNNVGAVKDLTSKIFSGKIEDQEYKDILVSIANRSSISQHLESNLLSFSYRSNFGTLNFRIKEGEYFSATVDGPISQFIISKNVQSVSIGEIQKFPAQAMHYREYSVGYSFSDNQNKISAGLRGKLYFGKGVFSSAISGSIQNISNNYELKTWGKGNISIPESNVTVNNPDISKTSRTNYLLNTGNPGIGVDLGLRYKITPNLSLALSVIDLGKINWKNNLNSKNFDGKYTIPSSSISKTYKDNIEYITKISNDINYADSISSLFILSYDRVAFSTPLPATFYAGLNYRINSKLRVSLVDRYVRLKELNQNSISLTAKLELNKGISINTGYSIIGDSFINIPFAILFDRYFGQIYVSTDNLAAFVIPSVSDYAGLSLGTCFYLFRGKTRSMVPLDYLPFFKPLKIKRTEF